MMTIQPPRTSRLDPVIEVLLIALLAFMPAAFGAVEAWSEGIAVTLGAATALCLALRAMSAGGREIRPSLAGLAVALFIAVAAAQLLPLPMPLVRAISPQTAAMKIELLSDLPDAAEVLTRETLTFYSLGTRQDLRIVLLATTIFAAVVTVYRDDRRIYRLLAAVALIGGAVAVLALAQDITRTTKIYWQIPLRGAARSGPFANHSHYGQFMNLSVGCALALLLVRLTEKHRVSLAGLVRRTWWLAAVIIVGLATISLSLTRGGIISILASAAFATIVLLASRNLRQMAGVVVVLLLAALAFVFYHGFDRVYARMLEPGGLGGRVQILRDTFEMIRTFPTVGVGLGAYEWVFPTFDRSFVDSTARYVENEYVQALVETGPLGLAAVMLFVGVIATRYFRAIRNHEDERIGLAAAGLGYGLVAVMVHSLSDFGQHLPAIGGLSAVTCGLLFNLGRRRAGAGAGGDGGGARRDAGAGWTIRLGRGAAVVALILVCLISAWALSGAARAWRGERHWNEVRQIAAALGRKGWAGTDEDFTALLAAASRAIAAEPDNAYYRYRAAIYRWQWVKSQVDDATGTTVVSDRTVTAAQRVIDDLNEARAQCPTFGLAYSLLGEVELHFLERPIGYAHLEAGYRLSRNDADAAVAAGRADALRGRFETAAQRFREAIRIDQRVVDEVIDVYLYEVERPELAADAIGAHYLGLIRLRNVLRSEERWKALSDRVEARAFEVLDADSRKPGAPIWWTAHVGAYHQEQHRYDLAEQYLSRALQHEPTNLHWRVRRAQVLHKLGRTREAIEDALVALQQHPDAPEAQRIVKQLTGARQ